MKDKRKQIIDLIPFLILYVLVFLMHIKMNLRLSDDYFFAMKLEQQTLFSHVIDLYCNINGKICTDTMAVIFTNIPKLFFAMVSSFMWVVIAYSISYVFLKDTIYCRIGAALGVLYLPASLLTSAGYVATSTNYIWTSAMFLFSLVSIKMFFEQKRVSKLLAIVFTAAVLYASNQEQTCVLLIVIFCSVICFFLKTKNTQPGRYFIYYMGILSLFSFVFIMTAPGHIKRSDSFSIFAIQNWTQLDFFDKIQLGISTTIAHYLSSFNLLYIILFTIVAVIIYQYHKEWRYRIIGMIPLLMSFLLNGLIIKSGRLYEISHYSFPLSYGQLSFVLVDAENYKNFISYLPVFLCLLLIFCILCSFYLIADDIKEFGMNAAILLGGVFTRMVMAFSQTLFGSDVRTHVYLYLSFIILLVRLMQKQTLLYDKQQSCVGKKVITIILGIIFLAGSCYSYYLSYHNIVV